MDINLDFVTYDPWGRMGCGTPLYWARPAIGIQQHFHHSFLMSPLHGSSVSAKLFRICTKNGDYFNKQILTKILAYIFDGFLAQAPLHAHVWWVFSFCFIAQNSNFWSPVHKRKSTVLNSEGFKRNRHLLSSLKPCIIFGMALEVSMDFLQVPSMASCGPSLVVARHKAVPDGCVGCESTNSCY